MVDKPAAVKFRVRHSALEHAATKLGTEAKELSDIEARVRLVGAVPDAPLYDYSFGKVPNSARLNLALDKSVELIVGQLESLAAGVGQIAGNTTNCDTGYRDADSKAAALYRSVAHRRRRKR